MDPANALPYRMTLLDHSELHCAVLHDFPFRNSASHSRRRALDKVE